MNILITGGKGFIGSHLAREFKDLGHGVSTYDIADGQDILWDEALSEAAEDVDVLIHCAAIAGIYRTSKDYSRTLEVNLTGTQNAIEAARENGVKLFIDFSTSEVYGPMIFDGKEDDDTTQGPVSEGRWAYAVSKLAGEYIVAHSGLPFVTVRPFNVFGPGQTGEGAIRDMILRAVKDEPITVYNDGTQIRSWCYISDFVSAIVSILEIDECRGQVYNIGNPQNTSTVLNLARKIIDMTGSDSQIEFKKHPGPEVHLRVPNIDRARDVLGFEPRVSLDEGLKATIKYYRSLR